MGIERASADGKHGGGGGGFGSLLGKSEMSVGLMLLFSTCCDRMLKVVKKHALPIGWSRT